MKGAFLVRCTLVGTPRQPLETQQSGVQQLHL
jgi:hypothetical protein